MHSDNASASRMALGGVLAALALCIMWLGGLLIVATYVSPMLCMLILQVVFQRCGKRTAWAWYAAVAILSLLLVSDQEAAWVFVFLGYYPIVKPALETRPLPRLHKAVMFNASILVLYWLLLHVMGLQELSQEFSSMQTGLLILLLVMGNVTFFLTDFALTKLSRVLANPKYYKGNRHGR